MRQYISFHRNIYMFVFVCVFCSSACSIYLRVCLYIKCSPESTQPLRVYTECECSSTNRSARVECIDAMHTDLYPEWGIEFGIACCRLLHGNVLTRTSVLVYMKCVFAFRIVGQIDMLALHDAKYIPHFGVNILFCPSYHYLVGDVEVIYALYRVE